MEVENGLPGSGAGVHHDAMTCIEPVLAREVGGDPVQMAQHSLIARIGLCCGGEVFSRDHQNMQWSLRMDIVKGDAGRVFVNNLGGSLACDDLAKDAGRVCHGSRRITGLH